MYPMDPQLFDNISASELSVDKQNILRQLSVMFCGMSLIKIRGICEECQWNVDLCIDKLISSDDDNNREQHQPMNPAKPPSFSMVLQKTGGAIPKAAAAGAAASYGSSQAKQQNGAALPSVYTSIYDNINNGYKIMILMRGAPGSGKSHLAKSIIKKLMPGTNCRDFILSADDYFYDSLGRYKYSIDQLSDAHNFCQTRAREKTSLGWSPVFIDNTNVKLWEMLPYVQTAVQNGYIVEFMEPVTPWRNSVGKLAAKNRHNVPKQRIQRMLDNYEVGTTSDVMALLKETKYTVTLPQLRTYPPPPVQVPPAQAQAQTATQVLTPIQSTNSKNEMETDNPNLYIREQRGSNASPVAASDTNSFWPNYENSFEPKLISIPKSPRENTRNRSQQQQQQQQQDYTMQQEPEESVQGNGAIFSEFSSFWNCTNDEDILPPQLHQHIPRVWNPYEKEASNFWGVPIQTTSTESTKVEPMNTDQNEGCGLLQLLKEGVKSINVPNREKTPDDILQAESNALTRHRVGCENEDKVFVSLRQIYSNKPIPELWDLFVKCKGDIDWAIDILLKDDDTVRYESSSDFIENGDNYECGCDNPLKDPPLLTNSPMTDVSVKPQRQRPARNRAPTAEILEVKEAVEKRFVLGDEHYSSHLKKIRNKRYANEDTCNRKGFADVFVQTEADENDNTSEEGGDGSEIIEINLGEDLIAQLVETFISETPTLTIPEKYKPNVFMPKSLARELYVLWMESVYNQLEDQRQAIMKEDEDFARLLNNPKYENCKQTPENIKELLDMEYAWMIYNSEKEQFRSATTVEHPNDLASHLTRMKLCEIFPNIAKDTLMEILAANNNKFSETVEVLKSSIQPATIDHQVSAKVLIEKARDENDKLNKEAEKQQEQNFKNNNVSRSSSFQQIHSISQQEDPSNQSVRKRSISPDEAKRLALKEFEEARNYAAHHCQLRAECYQKAKEAIQRGYSGVAEYYSNIANLHKKKIDDYNHRAANCIMEVHYRTQNNPEIIDLHYLHVIEAINCLDIFIDNHIAKLRSIFRSYKYVFIITGRGLHSTGGVSTIKTRVKSRLKERNLKWSEVNPGLLKVKIFSASMYAKNL